MTVAKSSEFPTTHWTEILQAGRVESPRAEAALARMCETYWYPIYAYIRRSGNDADAALDLTQSFFLSVVDRKPHLSADQKKGRFRTFLLSMVKNFLISDRRKRNRIKRGGGVEHVRLEMDDAEDRFLQEPAHEESPEKLFDRSWANALMARALQSLENEHAYPGQKAQFDVLKPHLMDPDPSSHYGDIAAELGINRETARVKFSRLRRRYREVYRKEVAKLVANPEDVEDEIRSLFAALAP